MKKVLLSVSLVAAAMFANAQDFSIYNGKTGESPLNGDPFIFAKQGEPGHNDFTVDTASTSPYVITAKGTTNGYYINGFGNARYSEDGDVEAIGYSATNFASDKIFLNVFTNGYKMKLKVQFGLVGSNDVYGYEFDLAGDAENAFTNVSTFVSTFSKLDGDDPDGVNFITSDLAENIGKMEFAVILTGNSGTGPGEIQIKNIQIGENEPVSILNPVSFKNAYTVSPNPATSSVTFGKKLTNVSVFNAQGLLVDNFASAEGLNVSSYNAGVYFIQSTEGAARIVVK